MSSLWEKHFKNPGGINELLIVSVPVIISQASGSLMMFTDRLLLTPIGKLHPAASMIGGFTATLNSIFYMGILSYITALTGQYLGAKKNKLCSVSVSQGFIFIGLVYPIILLSGHVLAPLYFDFAGTSEQETKLALQYFNIINLNSLFSLSCCALAAFFSGIGQTMQVMKINLIGLIINIPLSYLMINFGFLGHFHGIQGAAVSTLISTLLMFLLFIRQYMNENISKLYFIPSSFYFDRQVFKILLKFGGPTGLEFLLIFFAFSSFIALFHSYGEPEAVAITIAFNWDIVAFLPLWGLNIGLMGMVGRYQGSNQFDMSLRSTYSALKVAYSISLGFGVLFFFFSNPLTELFMTPDLGANSSKILQLSTSMLKMIGLYCFANATNLVFTATLRASGDTKICMVISLLTNWSMLASCYFSIRYLQLEPIWTWVLFVGFVFLESFVFTYRFLDGRWRGIRMV